MSRSLSDSEQSDSVEAEESDSSSSISDTTEEWSSTPPTSASFESHTESLELAEIGGELFRLPRGLCENENIFHEFFNEDMWRTIPAHLQEQLLEHLPRFSHILSPDEAYTEQMRTLTMLFNGSLQYFTQAPLKSIQSQLEKGNYRPDILKLRQSIAKSKRREQRFKSCERLSRIARDLFISREQLLHIVSKTSPGTKVSCEKLQKFEKPFSMLYDDKKLYSIRARKRFHREIEQLGKKLGIRNLSADEDDENLDGRGHSLKPDAPDGWSGAEDTILKHTPSSTDKFIYGTFFKRRHNIDDDRAILLEQRNVQMKLSNRNLRECLLEHKRRKLMEPNLPEFETNDIRLRDVYARAQMGGNFRHIFAGGKGLGKKLKASKGNETPAPASLQAGFNGGESFLGDKMPAHDNFQHPLVNHRPINDSKDNLFNDIQNNLSGYQNELLGDHEVFSMMDGEVELQQEEVQTYGTCEETIPAYVISNEVVLSSSTEENNKACSEGIIGHQLHQDNESSLGVKPHDDVAINAKQQMAGKLVADKVLPKAVENAAKVAKDRVVAFEKKFQACKLQKSQAPVMGALSPLQKSNNFNLANATASATHVATTAYTANTELIQETHACFFSLIRDFFCATPNHRMRFGDLKKKIDVWLCNPITALNDWFAQAESWSSLLLSAINFLAGDFKELPEEYVPYIEFKTQLNIYQWIGAGRDSDTRLTTLCTYWMKRRSETMNKAPAFKEDSLISPVPRRRSVDIEDMGVFDSAASPPPPPRCPTTWTVRAATMDEIAEFQRQERERFENPHRSYTYRMYGYESVVGPVKGIYSQIHALTKARGHSMMVGDRPNFVTILTLVRDATARLPNGEGTRADISELLKCSQYINREAAENVLQTIVSGALDRMHTEIDPCVRYDPKRKIWIYLHRNRSEEEFERMHQQSQGVSKQKKLPGRKHKMKSITKDGCTMELDMQNITLATESPNVTSGFSMPSLVPANPIIGSVAAVASSHHAQQKQHQHQHQHQNQQQQQQVLSKCPPVPPLKYNIPNQQQKSLLKTTLNSRSTKDMQCKEMNNAAPGSAASVALTGSTKQITFSAPQSRATVVGGGSAIGTGTGTASVTGTTSGPLLMSSLDGLQTLHVSTANAVISSSPTTVVTTMKQSPQHKSTGIATIGGKKVALNKPIIINQITQQSASKSKLSNKQHIQLTQNQGTQNFIIPINMASALTDMQKRNSFGDNFQVSGVDSSSISSSTTTATTTNVVGPAVGVGVAGGAAAGTGTGGSPKTQLQAKNFIRFVPSKNASGVKSIVTSPVVAQLQQVGTKQPVQIIGQRVVNASVRQQQQHQQAATNKTVTVSSGSGSTGTTSVPQINSTNIVKLSPQAFSSLQQKQQILIKQSIGASSQQQQRVVVGNTSFGTQAVQAAGKNVILKQMPVTVSAQKASGQSGCGNSGTVINVASPTGTKRIQAINASCLTPQQQRVLLQNLKQQQSQQHHQHQQQQPMQFKAVQVIGSSAPSTMHTDVVTSVSKTQSAQRTTAASMQQGAQQFGGKSLSTVVVSQPQVITRFIKTSSSSAASSSAISPQNSFNSNKSVNAIKIAGGTLKKSGPLNNVIQLASLGNGSASTCTSTGSGTGSQQESTQYAIVSQGKNILTLGPTTRLITTQASSLVSPNGNANSNPGQSRDSVNTSVVSTVNAPKILTSSSSGGGGGGGGVGSLSQIAHGAKVISKVGGSTVNAQTATSMSNIRLINATTASTLNLGSMQNKQVVFTTKSGLNVGTVMVNQGHDLQNAGIIIGNQAVKIQSNAPSNQQMASKGTVVMPQQQTQMQTVIMGNQILRVQQLPQTVKVAANRATVVSGNAVVSESTATVTNSGSASVVVNNDSLMGGGNSGSGNMPKAVVIGSSGQTIRLQSGSTPTSQLAKNIIVSTSQANSMKANPQNRVVLAVQGGGQIFLSPNLQGNSINLKSLQNVKMLPISQAGGSKEAHIIDRQSPNFQTQKFSQQSVLKTGNSTGKGGGTGT